MPITGQACIQLIFLCRVPGHPLWPEDIVGDRTETGRPSITDYRRRQQHLHESLQRQSSDFLSKKPAIGQRGTFREGCAWNLQAVSGSCQALWRATRREIGLRSGLRRAFSPPPLPAPAPQRTRTACGPQISVGTLCRAAALRWPRRPPDPEQIECSTSQGKQLLEPSIVCLRAYRN